MRSVFDIAKSHISLPVLKDINALKSALRDWKHYTEILKLQEKTTHSATLCISVHPQCTSSVFYTTTNNNNSTFLPLRKSFSNYSLPGEFKSSIYKKRVSLQLWTALLPWEVQRGLSLSELRLPSLSGCKDESGNSKCASCESPDEEGEKDPFGVITTPQTSRGWKNGFTKTRRAKSNFAPAPGMLFVMDVESAKQGVNFWSGAIMQPIDVAFISPVEPAVTNSLSFQQLQRCKSAVDDDSNAADVCDLRRFFPDGELDSPTVTFAVQSYSHLDPFPHCDATGVTGQRKYMAESVDVDKGCGVNQVRYVLETTRHLLHDSISEAMEEYSQLNGSRKDSVEGKKNNSNDKENVEFTIALELSDELKEELREKARLYNNYVRPLEELISHHIRLQNCLVSANTAQTSKSETCNDAKEVDANDSLVVSAEDSLQVSSVPSNTVVAAKSIISPEKANMARMNFSRLRLRSPMLSEENEDLPLHLAPSLIGKHEAHVLQKAEKEQNQLINAKELSRRLKISSHMTILPPIDYELFDLCLRLGLCRHDAIYYFYGRIMREWQSELRRLTKGGGADRGELHEADVRRMLLLVRDPSLQVPEELSSCVEAVAQCRGITN